MTKPTLQYVESFAVTGFCTKTKNSEEFNPTTAKIPALWQQFYSSNLSNHTPVFGVYSDYESDASGFYTITVGVSDENEQANVNKKIINAGNYLVFSKKGPMPATVIDVWKQIWNYFSEENNYQRNFISDFEIYNGSDQVAVYIGIK
jgi:predicted transcriptional regulator YdeE